ncbi:MAG TPA: ATP-dependent DNA helicase [Candidatus Lumbricidophila sp.]|nr:ATP-dependent DNA helicase [Candidatus Lumbricidophila sp.]
MQSLAAAQSAPADRSAPAIAARLGLHAPTAEQREVIEAQPTGPSLVVAGAGSGKTETMANRVVWLLANGHVTEPQVLGLTFTRKAASELAERVRVRCAQLAASDRAADPAGSAAANNPLEGATVMTYNAFAASISREHALSVGRDPDATVLGEAAAWQLARSIVVASDDPRLLGLDKSVDSITEAVLALSRAIGEHAVEPSRIHAFAAEFSRLPELPLGPRRRAQSANVTEAVAAVGALEPLTLLAERFAATKRARGLVEFSDQVGIALEICATRPDVVAEYRERFRAVLLDEYQDTSVVQTRLLAALFGDRIGAAVPLSVMAVGDPDQAIYGWRGASAASLARFADDFAADATTVPVFHLSTSWRNSHAVLAAANTLITPLDSGVPKRPLAASPVAGPGAVHLAFTETVYDEADAVADWFAERMRVGSGTGAGTQAPTAALLCRANRHIPRFAAALRRRGIPVHVLGLDALLGQPVIADLVCALRVLHDPSAGAELVRLLAGARWMIGAADLAALAQVARLLNDRETPAAGIDDGASIVDALDFVCAAAADHRWLAGFTEAGRERLRRIGTELQGLRRRAGLPLADFVMSVAQELLLDIEVLANPEQVLGQASLDAFADLVRSFADGDEAPTLGAFLGWLVEAERRDRLTPRIDEPVAGAVQILTIHGSKGLEWDYVAVPRLVGDELPAKLRSGRGWVAFGCLPAELQGDADQLPEFAWRDVDTQVEFDAEFERYRAAVRTHAATEDRRLAYVALTRARHELLLAGSWWAGQQTPRGPSEFLAELADAGLIGALPAAPEGDRPDFTEDEPASWPLDPLGHRRGPVASAAAAVERAAERPSGEGIDPALLAHLHLLIEERERHRQPLALPAPPTRVRASGFKDYLVDAADVLAAAARPMPRRPTAAATLGTQFHEWVEVRSGDAPPAPFGDELGALGDGWIDRAGEEAFDDERLASLQATFEASEWGIRRPIAVEREVHLPLGDHVFVCRLDAVFDVDPASELGQRGIRYEVVDWKTGRAPRDADDLALRASQLALYRIACAWAYRVDLDEVSAAFYFIESDRTIRPQSLAGPDDLLGQWRSSLEAAAAV